MPFTYDDFTITARYIQEHITFTPRIGIILGSGLGPLAESLTDAVILPYADIPNWHSSAVKGHASQLVIGQLEGQPVLAMQGRAHWYETNNVQEVVFPVRVMQMMGIETLVVTNAAGGINPNFNAGDIMLITDHINLGGMSGFNPLMGPNDERLGPRFPILTTPYDQALRKIAQTVAQQENIPLQQGVYVGLSGPSFETPAEIRMLRAWGADAVGMSTVNEVLVANHAGMRVLGISSISNTAIDQIDSEQDVSHDEVLEVGKQIVPRLLRLLPGIIREVA
ncbi:MAG: purine-nucleoside phosphorylase [Anaerolineales bacterium]